MQRREILAAAAELFSENGYHNVSMDEIARRAEFGKGTLYKFFPNKEELFTALMFETIQGLHNTVMAVLGQDRDPIAIINEYVAVMWRHHRKDIKLLRLFIPETDGPGFDPRAQAHKNLSILFDQFMKKLSLVFERGIKEGVFRQLDPYFMAAALASLMFQSLKQSMRDPELLKSEDLPSAITDILFEGVLSAVKKDRA
jgi:TetR/AcrR family transcriptional regulator